MKLLITGGTGFVYPERPKVSVKDSILVVRRITTTMSANARM